MITKNCLQQLKKTLIFTTISLIFVFTFFFLFSKTTYSAANETINVEGKIVRNDSGYEGMNVTAGSPVCVVSGNANDTCDFQVKYYSSTTLGTLFLTETFENVEIGQYNGAFNVSLGTGITVAGTYTSLTGLIQKEDSIYLEISFSPLGNGTYTEVFSRMPLQSSAYSIRSKYSSGASGAFQFASSADSSTYTNPTSGMVYFDTTSNTLKIYNGSSWENIASGSSGTNLWTDAGTYTNLTSSTDSFALGSSSYTGIGTQIYTDYLLGLTSNAPFSFDTPTERLSISGDQQQSGLTVLSNYSGTNSWPLVTFQSNSVNFDSTILNVVQNGTGKLATFYKGSTEAFSFENEQTFLISQRTGTPTTTSDRLYNVGGVLYWNGSSICTLASGCGTSSLWTDSGTYTYLTSTTDNVGIGGNTPETSKFFFDVTNGRLGIGTSTPSARLDIAGADSTISNSLGDITILPSESLVVKANDSNPDNLQEWQNSIGTILSLINQNGYASIGRSTSGNAILNLGANTGSVPQMNLTSSNSIDVLAPSNGDLWWNGTNLYFFDGTKNHDLLSTNSNELLKVYGLTPNNGYLNLNHNLNTYSMDVQGYVCVGGSYDQNCTGGSWQNIDTFVTSFTHTANSDWTGTASNVTVNTGDLELSGGNSGIYTSSPISTANARSYGSLSWEEQLGSTGKISVQTRSGNMTETPYEYMTNGQVNAQQLSADGKTLYIGGDFTSVYEKYYGSGIGVDITTGKAVSDDCPTVNGNVLTSISDGSGGWYIGGAFTSVGSVTRNRIAHINADCSLDLNFNPNASSTVNTLLLDGTTLYVGGSFTTIGGQTRNRIAAIDTTTGLATTFNPNANSTVSTLLIYGTTLYVGGYFTTIGGQTRNRIAAIDTTTGLATTFDPNASAAVVSFLLDGSILYVGGSFTTIGGQTRNYIAAIDTTTGLATSFDPNANSYIASFTLDGTILYVGGGFTTIGGQTRMYIAAIDTTTGLATTFNPNPNSNVFTLLLDDTTLYVGGQFNSIGGQSRNRIAAIDTTTGLATSFKHDLDSHVRTLVLDGTILYIGGEFKTIVGQTRNNIAAIDTATGTVTSFNPNAENVVNTLLLDGTILYVGGSFISIGGQTRNRIAAIDTTTGLATTFNPNANNNVYSLFLNGSTLYVGGQFNSIGGQSRNYIAAIDVIGNGGVGTVTSFNPNANHFVKTIVLDGSTLYVGGGFTTIGGQSRNKIAAIDTSTGLATIFDANITGYYSVSTLALDGNTLYIGGGFTTIGGQTRNRIAAIDVTGNGGVGTVTNFNPNANNDVYSLFLNGSTLYVGGRFNSIGGQSRNYIAAIDVIGNGGVGTVTSFNPNANSTVSTLLIYGTTLYVGGSFTTIGGQPRNNIVPIDTTTSQVATIKTSSWDSWKDVNKISLNNSNTHTTWVSDGVSVVSEGDIVRSVTNFEDEDESDMTNLTKVVTSATNQYVQSTIPVVDLSTYDYITMWVYSDQVGASLQLAIGEDSSTLKTNTINIASINTWQKVYWNITAIPQGERDAISILRLTNLSSSANTFYIDNVSAEKLPSNKTGFEISSPVDKYIQYRVILTNTDNTSLPKLESVTLDYATSYDIVYEDSNNIRLYNYSGSDQYLKLQAQKEDMSFVSGVSDGSGAIAFSFNTTNELINPSAKLFSINNAGNEKMYLDASGNLYVTGDIISSKGKYLNLAPSIAQVDNIDNSNSIWINKTGVGGNLVRLQSNGSDRFIVSSGGDMTMSGNAQVDGGTLKLGSNGNIRFNGTSNQLEISKDGGTTWVSMGDGVGKIVLSAEYSGAVLSADGTNNVGSMTSDNTGSVSNSMNYYEWNSSELTLNDYDIRLRLTLPSDFESWGSGGITIHYTTESSTLSNNKLDVYVFEQSQSVVDSQVENLVSTTGGVWSSSTLSGSTLDQCTGKGTTCLIDLKLSSLGDNYTRVGDIVLTYTRTL